MSSTRQNQASHEWSEAKHHAAEAKEEAVEAGKHATRAVSARLEPEGHKQHDDGAPREVEKQAKGIIERVRDAATDLSARLHITAGKPSDNHGNMQLQVLQRDRYPFDFAMGPDYNPQRVGDAIDAAADSTKHAVDTGAHYSKVGADRVATLAGKARDNAAAGLATAESKVESAAHQVVSHVRETKDWVVETKDWVCDKVEEAADAWVDEITPHNEEEALLEQGLIPSNTADVLAARGA